MMPGEIPTYELIEEYLSGDMNPSRKKAFEDMLEREPDMMEMMLTYKKLQEEFTGMETARTGEGALKENLASLNQQYFSREEKKMVKRTPVRSIIITLAAAASILFAFFLLKPVLFGTGDKNLFNRYYEEETFSSGRGNTDSTGLAAGFYNAKNYDRALEILEPYTSNHPDATDLLLYLGRCYLQTEKYAKADALFSTIAGGNTVYRDKAQFLQALSMLKQQRKDECRKLLLQVKEKSAYYKKAQELLGEL
jgi:tetratricopeptide (TPR) repeat protein